MFNTSTTTKGASNLFSNIAKNAAQTTNAVASTTTKALNQVSSIAGDVVEAANNAVNKGMNAMANTAKSIPIVNNLLPLGNAATNAAKKNNAAAAVANAVNVVNKNATAAANALTNAANNAFENVFPNAGQTAWPWWVWALAAFVVIVVVVAIVLTVYKDQVKETWAKIKSALGMGPKEEKPPVAPTEPVEAPPAPEAPAEPSLFGQATGLISKILPGKKEVFNVSSNEFTYYDAEPMCKALGAQLATYDQVQEAWKKGADWCNYGWVKGQMAVFPTQKDTYATLQTGPPEDQTACGVPGVNGGFFDNPEMRFGVNCYGVKPEQTANDERILQERGLLPESPATLKIDQQAQEYKERLASIGVLPFNGSAWSA